MGFIDDAAVVPKLCGVLIFSITSVIIGLLPMIVHTYYKKKPVMHLNSQRKAKYKRFLSHMSAFGGGVLLSTTFLHLLPEIRKSIEITREKNVMSYKESLQLPELLMCLGFLLLYLIEEIAHKIISSRKKVQDECMIGFTEGYNSNTEPSNIVQGSEETSQQCRADGTAILDCEKQMINVSTQKNGDGLNFPHNDNRISCHQESMIFFTESSGRNFLLIFALSIHEGFEGLAIGLEHQPDAVWYMVLGVGSHKAVIAFCIGVQMLFSKLDRKVTIVYILVFATATSLGVLIGLCLSMESGIFSVVLQGLATGTLLHVVFFELLKPHLEQTPFLGVFLGFTCMAILKYFSP